MNKYDDIKRFMDKTKVENLDYKELSDKSTGKSITGSMNQWTLIKQVSAREDDAEPLDNGRTTQPTPQSISEDEFSLSAAQVSPRDLTPQPSAAHPVTHAQTVPLSAEVPPPAAGFGLLDALRETLPPMLQPAAPAYVSAPAPVNRPSPVSPAPVTSASAETNQRFKQMFKQLAPQPASAYLHRDTPLQPLLEMIASCR